MADVSGHRDMWLVYKALQVQLLFSSLSSASLTLTIEDPTGSLVFPPDVTSEISFSLSGFSGEENITIHVQHKPETVNSYTTLCRLHQTGDNCTSLPVDVCQCLTRDPEVAKYRIRKVFHSRDSGVLQIVIWGSSRLARTFNITTIPTGSRDTTVAFVSTDTPGVENVTSERLGVSNDYGHVSSISETNVTNIAVIGCLAVLSACAVVVSVRCLLTRRGSAQHPQRDNRESVSGRTNSHSGNPVLTYRDSSGGSRLVPGQYDLAWYSPKADENTYTEIDMCGHGTYLSPEESHLNTATTTDGAT